MVLAFVRWFAWGGLGVVVAAVVVSALVGSLRVLLVLHRQGRRAESVPVRELRHRLSGAAGRTTVVTVVVGLLAWGACGFSVHRGTVDGIAATTSRSDLVGSTRPPTPAPVGPVVRGYPTVVIGDSRAARVGGPPVPNATAQNSACGRSSDSLAEELSLLRGEPVLNLACSGVSVSSGLRGPQVADGVVLDPQVGRLRNVEGVQRVVVVIGPNDLAWTDFLQYCYGLQRCDDRLTGGEFSYRMAAVAHPAVRRERRRPRPRPAGTRRRAPLPPDGGRLAPHRGGGRGCAELSPGRPPGPGRVWAQPDEQDVSPVPARSPRCCRCPALRCARDQHRAHRHPWCRRHL